MRGRDYTASTDFLNALFGDAEGVIELRACPNVKGEAGALSQMTDTSEQRAAFCEKKDGPGMGLYFGVCTRVPGATSGNLASVASCPALWVDIDCAKEGLKGDDVLTVLAHLPHPPSFIVNSGGGLHAYWKLEEPVDVSGVSEQRQRVQSALRQLALILAGDTQCAELARIMRLPGTTNSKPATLELYDGQAFICEVVETTGRVHDFDELAEWASSQRVLLQGKVKTSAGAPREDDPFLQYAREAGYNPSIDVDAELAKIGADIHGTQLRVSASMIARGFTDEEIFDRLLVATSTVGESTWNWNAEEKKIRNLIATGRAKGFDKPRPQPMVSGNNALKLVPTVEDPLQKPRGDAKTNDIVQLGVAALGVWKDRYGPIMATGGVIYSYEQGVWSAWDEARDQLLRVLIQEAAARLEFRPAAALLNAAERWIIDNPRHMSPGVVFDEHGLIIAEDGTLDPRTMERGGHSPALNAKFRIGVRIDGPRECPTFLAFLASAFSDKPADEARSVISTFQEWLGASLVAKKTRPQRKGLLIHGGSRTGKTQVSDIVRAMLGDGTTSAMKVREIEKDFGLQTLLGKRGWIADDAVGQGETLDAENYKNIVTGEKMNVTRKNKTSIDGVKFGFPVLLTMNNLFKVKDGSDAVYNRSLIMPMTRVRAETEAEPVGYDSISEKIIAEELTGVFWWALEGWQRLSARGFYDPPKCMTQAISDLQDANNAVGKWARECVVVDPLSKVKPSDLFASFAGWYFQENGEGKFPWSQNGFSRKLKENIPSIEPERESQIRWASGLSLNEDGLENWSINAARDEYRRVATGTLERAMVNQVVINPKTASEAGNGRTIF